MKRTIGKFAFSFMLMMLLLMPFWAEAANPILISGAMECETDFLIKALSNSKEQRIGGWRFVSGDYQGIPIVVSVTSVGMTNAAAATTLGDPRRNRIIGGCRTAKSCSERIELL